MLIRKKNCDAYATAASVTDFHEFERRTHLVLSMDA
jgi:hypothetical protein